LPYSVLLESWFLLWNNVGAYAQNTSTAGNSTTTTSSQMNGVKS